MIVVVVDAHRWKTDFAVPKRVNPLAFKPYDLGVELQRTIDVFDIQHYVIHVL